MNAKTVFVSILTSVVLLSPFWISHLVWRFFPTYELNLLVVDYTVPTTLYSHHRGLFWLLNHLRIQVPNRRDSWRFEKDYVGYKPDSKDENTYLYRTALDGYQWIYMADTYGVYDIDMKSSKQKEIAKIETPKLIFGGFGLLDAKKISDYVVSGGNVVVEFNSFTGSREIDARHTMEELLGIEWTGWVGRFYEDLTDETIIPHWLPDLYRSTYRTEDIPKGPAIMLVHINGTLVVLRGERLELSAPFLVMTENGKRIASGPYGSPSYFGWFSIVRRIDNDTEVLAKIQIPKILDWNSICRKKGIPSAFPLITSLRRKGSVRMYIAANIANLDDTPSHYQLAGLPLLQAAVHRRRDTVSNRPAYWQFFVPVMSGLLKKVSTVQR